MKHYVVEDFVKDLEGGSTTLSRDGLRKLRESIEKDQNSPLCNNQALFLYAKSFAKPDDLIGMSHEQIAALASENAISIYKSGKGAVTDFKGLEVEEIEALTSWDAMQAYKSGNGTIADLKSFKLDKIKALTSDHAIEAYNAANLTIADLKCFETDKIEALTTWNAIKIYRSDIIAPSDCFDLEVDKIKDIFSSHKALESFIKLNINSKLTTLSKPITSTTANAYKANNASIINDALARDFVTPTYSGFKGSHARF
ncbi:MAG: hypothetical protein K0R73_865 [Candidatus Midichloriaceae bacterium]|jgi:hypothetical protein|nr:hypothetical protein [Candidatus Midichloriaceae bacterium]